ncbi:MAG: DUF4011 domain-containing protein [Candidatus Bathyarchaeota archaeon]|nr:MAG: DUF4011 domain-containing protein [Candidatus Bathyarchaeota archaeon]
MSQFNEILSDKIKYWKCRLIDLSRRNNLISYRFTKSKSVLVSAPNISGVFDAIDENNVILFQKTDDVEDQTKGWISSEDDSTTNKKLYNIYLKARENFQELGVNTCFLGIGFLEYKDSEWSTDLIKAPLILMPVEIERTKKVSKFYHKFDIFSEPDDFQLNPSLKEKLAAEYGINLEEIEEGTDIYEYLDQLKQIISQHENWKFLEEVVLDIFTYQKYIMYNDLELNDENIKENPLIRAFVGDRNALLGDYSEILREEFNDVTDVDVFSADSSQKRAIELAKAGATFVLQGPPGTGKSQTICNIIAALIEKKKKVLFVSQKMAALDVVLNRLKEKGLDRYCLNLHAYRGNKKQIIAQLMDQLENSPIIKDYAKQYSFSSYLKAQSKINDYYKNLCEKRVLRKLSLFDVRGKLAKLEDTHNLNAQLSNTLNINDEEFLNLIDNMEKLDIILDSVVDPLNNLYRYYKPIFNTTYQRANLKNDLNNMLTSFEILFNYVNSLPIMNDENKPNTFKEMDLFIENHEKINALKIPIELLSDNFFTYHKLLKEIFPIFERINEIKSEITSQVSEKFLEMDTSEHQILLTETGLFGKLFSSKYKTAKKELDELANTPLEKNNWLKLFDKKAKFMENVDSFNSIIQTNITVFQKLKIIDNHEIIPVLLELTTKILKIIDQFDLDQQTSLNIIQFMKTNSCIFTEYLEIKNSLKILEDYFENLKLVDYGFDQIPEIIKKLIKDHDKIDYILLFYKTFNELSTELMTFVKLYLENRKVGSLQKCFEKTYYLQLLDKIERSDRIFSPKLQIEQFRNKDVETRNIKRFKIMNTIESSQPSYTYDSCSNSEVQILKRENRKKRRVKPIRKLLQDIPNLTFSLTPCFMMSPLTVSQYLDYPHIHFDVVIFDEASQIMPEDAIPCFLRADQAIIMGDTEQLPPTSFFNRGLDDEDFDEDIVDLESLLSEASIKFRESSLNWHYRSKNENLIAFSNYCFYKNRLITFPNSKQDAETGIDFVFVKNGVYDRGKSRTNRKEAKNVVSTYKKLKKENPSKTFGIIAFSRQQERAIRDAFLLKNIDIDNSIDDMDEPLFIKNLETVQGDERDIIIISVGYGPDEKGKFSYNFGPLNKEGGYKRLNVAVTRSRYKTIIISSIDPQFLDEDKINVDGVRYLKNYLSFAKTSQMPELTKTIEGIEFDSDFEEAVYDALKNENFELSTQIGCSGYRIDLGIKNPEKPGEYILGIECDGTQYHSSRFARDRDKIRQNVLEKLGWNIHRIWSEDWLKNREFEIQRIKTKVEQLSVTPIKESKKKEHFERVETVNHFKEVCFDDIFPKYTVKELQKIDFDLEWSSSRGYWFYDNNLLILERMLDVINIEAPMTKTLLFQRVSKSLSIGKIGNRLNNYFEMLLELLERKEYLFNNGSTLSTKPIKKLERIRISNSKQRRFECIPIEELASACVELLKINVSMEKDGLIQDVARKFYGNNRCGTKIEKKMNETISYLKKEKIIIIHGNNIKLK